MVEGGRSTKLGYTGRELDLYLMQNLNQDYGNLKEFQNPRYQSTRRLPIKIRLYLKSLTSEA